MGELIMFRRRSLRITQKQLAQRAKISPRTLYAIENGDDSVSFKTFLKVLDLLDFKLELHRVPLRSEYRFEKYREKEPNSKNVQGSW